MMNPSPTLAHAKLLAKRLHDPKAIAELRQIAAGQAVRRDCLRALTHEHFLLSTNKDAEKVYGFSIAATRRKLARAPRGDRTLRRFAEREVARHDRQVSVVNARRELYGKIYVQTLNEPPIVLTPEQAAAQREALCKLGRTPSAKANPFAPAITAASGKVYDRATKQWIVKKDAAKILGKNTLIALDTIAETGVTP